MGQLTGVKVDSEAGLRRAIADYLRRERAYVEAAGEERDGASDALGTLIARLHRYCDRQIPTEWWDEHDGVR